MRILVTGDRRWSEVRPMLQFLYEGIVQPSSREDHIPASDVQIIEGEAPGADTMSRELGHFFGYDVIGFPANWSLGRKAGPIRNTAMLKSLMRDDDERVVVAFHDDLTHSKGTANMVGQAERAGVTVVHIGRYGIKRIV